MNLTGEELDTLFTAKTYIKLNSKVLENITNDKVASEALDKINNMITLIDKIYIHFAAENFRNKNTDF